MPLSPWICPKCQRVWGPLVDRCRPCNDAVDAARMYPGQWTPPIKRATNEM